MNSETIENMKNVDIRTVDLSGLVDIRDVDVNHGLPKDERIKDYMKQIKNPYCYKVGKIAVKVCFTDGGATLENRLESLLTNL